MPFTPPTLPSMRLDGSDDESDDEEVDIDTLRKSLRANVMGGATEAEESVASESDGEENEEWTPADQSGMMESASPRVPASLACDEDAAAIRLQACLLYTSPSPRDS